MSNVLGYILNLHFFCAERATRVTTFARNLHFFRSRISTKITAIFFARRYQACTRNVRTGVLLKVSHRALLQVNERKYPLHIATRV